MSTPYTAEAVPPQPVLSFAPVVLSVPGRPIDLELRVTAPVTGGDLPVILFSHGAGPSHHLSSHDGYAPLRDFWAARGFVVVQPTHLASARLAGDARLDPADPQAPAYWRSRVTDITSVLDHLDDVEAAVPGLAGRVDRRRIAVVGHSMGGLTASQLLGAEVTDPADGAVVDLRDPRITAGVLLAAPGRGGDTLVPAMAARFPFFSSLDLTTMTTPTLVVVGDQDASAHLTSAGWQWHADGYHLAPGGEALVTLTGGGHNLGGVSGYDVAETDDDSLERVAAVQWLTWAYLRTQLGLDDTAFSTAASALESAAEPLGRVESK